MHTPSRTVRLGLAAVLGVVALTDHRTFVVAETVVCKT